MEPISIKIIKQLKAAGHEAYWAGGCVRDILLGIKPKDYDIVTSAKPDEIEDILEKTIPIGKEFGVILALQDDHEFEVATFRSDSGYSDGRRPDAVEFTNAEEDAKRRDFTINAMFYDPTEDKIYDFVDGQKDLEAGLVRFIGEPEQRILEDHLRVLRAVRFKNVYDFQYHPDTYNAVKKYAEKITDISNERIRDELNKMIIDKKRVEAFNDMEDLGLLEIILPEIQELKGVAQPAHYHKEGDVYDHTMQALGSIPEGEPLSLYWAVLLHDVGKPDTFELEERIRFDGHAERSAEIAGPLLRRLRFSKNFTKKVQWLAEQHMSVYNVLDMPKATRIKWFLKPWFLELLELNKHDILGTDPADLSTYEEIKELYTKEVSELPDELPKLLSGKDIMEIKGIKPGPELGVMLEDLEDLQLEGTVTTREQALEWLNNYPEHD